MGSSNMARLDSGLITEADLTALDEDGAIIVRNVFDRDWVERTRRASAAAVERQLAGMEAAGRPRPTEPAFHNVLYMHLDDPEFRVIALQSPAALLARDLMQTDKVVLYADHLLVKEPGTQTRTPWHQDLPYWPVRGRQITSLWIALDPVTRDSGALEYVRGSHRWGKMYQPQNFDGSGGYGDFEPLPDIEGERDRYAFLQWDLEPGDVIVHDVGVLHGAGANARQDRSRRALSLRYVGDDARWHAAGARNVPAGVRVADLQDGDPLDKDGAHMVAPLPPLAEA
ncbi:phytanoyl-CoA dioxygenase family protein [Sphingomonas sp. YL-JM2C]